MTVNGYHKTYRRAQRKQRLARWRFFAIFAAFCPELTAINVSSRMADHRPDVTADCPHRKAESDRKGNNPMRAHYVTLYRNRLALSASRRLVGVVVIKHGRLTVNFVLRLTQSIGRLLCFSIAIIPQIKSHAIQIYL